jgi:hypothetical protein
VRGEAKSSGRSSTPVYGNLPFEMQGRSDLQSSSAPLREKAGYSTGSDLRQNISTGSRIEPGGQASACLPVEVTVNAP